MCFFNEENLNSLLEDIEDVISDDEKDEVESLIDSGEFDEAESMIDDLESERS